MPKRESFTEEKKDTATIFICAIYHFVSLKPQEQHSHVNHFVYINHKKETRCNIFDFFLLRI